jgi:hypothetical protein
LLLGDLEHRLTLYGHDNTAVTRFAMREPHRGTLISLNDTAHLERVSYLEPDHPRVSAEEAETDPVSP